MFHTFLDEQQEISKSLKIGIFPKGLVHGFAPKFEIFPSFYFWQKRPENVLKDILERKNAFLDYRNTKFKKSKNWHFSKPMVLAKNWPFFHLFLGNIGQENVFYDILERKNAFLDYKNQTFKKSKTGISQRG